MQTSSKRQNPRDIAARVCGVGKAYKIASGTTAATTLGEAVANRIRNPLKRMETDTFWALRDVEFELKRGEVLGIIGRNGAGKSTLLKILSRITEPTTGVIELFGRVGSLLEVGTGFHPELTGRENIYLNGAILGMSRQEIAGRFDEIVAFSEVERFLDTPVKRYSSGMYVRLAFAVAAHLEPEILIVDEVLAVGDASFQKKCLGKMGEVAKHGRTVLFVSHNMAAVEGLCTKAMVLTAGEVSFPPGSQQLAIDQYLNQVKALAATSLSERVDREGEGRIRIIDLGAYDSNGRRMDVVISGQSIDFRIHYQCVDGRPCSNIVVAISITSFSGIYITMMANHLQSDPFDEVPASGYFICNVPRLPLTPGGYTLNVIIRQNDIIQDYIREAETLTVEAGDYYGTGRMPPLGYSGVFFDHVWSKPMVALSTHACP